MAGAQIPDAVVPGLDLFAAAWLEEWTRSGGYVISRPDNEGSIGYPMDPPQGEYPTPAGHLPVDVQDRTRAFSSAHYAGKMRAMLAMLDAVPHGREALRVHMQAHAIVSYHGQPGTAQ